MDNALLTKFSIQLDTFEQKVEKSFHIARSVQTSCFNRSQEK